jgi:hypothetical protein
MAEARVLKIWVNLWCVLLLVMPIALAIGTESNAVSYWNELGNNLFNQGNITGAINCYNKAIELENQTNAPIFTEIVIQCGYRMDALDKNNSTQVFSKICAESTSSIGCQRNPDSEDITLCFDVSNPNDMHMRIGNIYANVLDYNSIRNPKIIENFGVKKTRGYFCNIEPKIGSYKCIQTLNDNEFIDLAPGDLEHFAIDVRTDTPGIYKMRIDLDYVIGSETNSIIVGDLPEMIGFFNKKIAQSQE